MRPSPVKTRSTVIYGKPLPSRRGVLKVVAVAATVPALAASVRAVAPKGRFYNSQLDVMGTLAEMGFWHDDPVVADRTMREISAEIGRLNSILSLSDGNSEISRLNRDGYLDDPTWEMRDVLTAGIRFSELSDGAFDMTVQPLWDLYAAHFWTGSDKSPDIDSAARQVAQSLVNYRLIEVGARRITLGRTGMGVTLNSIGQGFVADRIADILIAKGFAHVYADLGEIRLIGDDPNGGPWRIGLRDPKDPSRYGQVLNLADIGLAVSGGYGTLFEETGRYHHIFDPRTGLSANKMTSIAVTAPSAMVANGLATSIYVAGCEYAGKILAAYPGAKAVITTADDEWLISQADGSFAAT